jgi:uncharacterized C2H2 Zn-finger protein
MRKKYAIFKFNSGNLAILCSRCNTIVKEGKDFTEEEWVAARNTHNNPSKKLSARYCNKCVRGNSFPEHNDYVHTGGI